MKITRRLLLTAAAATAVSVSAVALVSAVPEIAPGLALAGILAGGALLSTLLAMSRGATPALVTLAMFVSLLPLLAVAGEQAMLLWLACWAFIGVASRKISMQAIVERVTRTAA
jgi:hypothetical protein